jgi:hypothetical protein
MSDRVLIDHDDARLYQEGLEKTSEGEGGWMRKCLSRAVGKGIADRVY